MYTGAAIPNERHSRIWTVPEQFQSQELANRLLSVSICRLLTQDNRTDVDSRRIERKEEARGKALLSKSKGQSRNIHHEATSWERQREAS